MAGTSDWRGTIASKANQCKRRGPPWKFWRGEPTSVSLHLTKQEQETRNEISHADFSLGDCALACGIAAGATKQRRQQTRARHLQTTYRNQHHGIETTRTFFERMAIIDRGPLSKEMEGAAKNPPDRAAIALLSASPYYNALLRTTCVPTRLDAGHANNALPQDARAIVNCRILPGGTQEETEKTLVKVLDDSTDKGHAAGAPAR
ncbi:MAG: peptidase dimerization domain-containing protein [Candidatus Acidiferrales bacterium]